jgi:PAS domain S-box-containing protein
MAEARAPGIIDHVIGEDLSIDPIIVASTANAFFQNGSKNVDYAYLTDYAKVGGKVDLMVGSPVWGSDDSLTGFIFIEIDESTVMEVMEDVEGLGSSGECYLINHDLQWLTHSKFEDEGGYYLTGMGLGRGYTDIYDTILDPDAAIDTDGVKEAFAGKKEVAKSSNLGYRDVSVMGSYHYMEVNSEENAPWVLVTEIDVSEALASPLTLQQISIWIMVAVAGVVAVIAFIIARQIANPVKELSDLSETIAGGNYDVEVDIKAQDEVEDLVANFRVMKENVLNALKYSENLITGLPVSVLAIDNDFNIEKLNPTLESLLGIKAADLIGKKCYDIFRYDLCNTENCLVRKAWRLNGISDCEDVKTHNRGDQEEMELRISASPLVDGKGNTTGGIEVFLDVTLENQMKHEAKLSLNLIRKNSLEKEILLGEIHHRVKNNMQIVSSLLKLQGKKISDSNVRQIFEECNNRINVISHIHEILYQSKDFSGIIFSEYIENLCKNLYQLYGINSNRITLNLDTEALTFKIGVAIPCGLIINEIVSNSLKYAFSDSQSGEIKILLKKIKDKKVYLSIQDNGIGLPRDIDFRTLNTLGLNLAKNLTEHQLHGQFNIISDNGTKIEVSFDGKD